MLHVECRTVSVQCSMHLCRCCSVFQFQVLKLEFIQPRPSVDLFVRTVRKFFHGRVSPRLC